MEFPNSDFFEFISQNRETDPNILRLSSRKNPSAFDIDAAITQIECRKKFATKLNNFIIHREFLFPDSLSGEQASHQAIALYHSTNIDKAEKILDMTAGLGIDAVTFALRNKIVTALEINPSKASFLKLNAKTLKVPKLDVLNVEAIEYLKKTPEKFNLIFIDPSRRDNNLKRVYNLKDCSPNVILHQDLLLEKADIVLIKASPLLDITQTIKDFKDITSIKAIGVKGECKEILIELSRNPEIEVQLAAINLNNNGDIISEFIMPVDRIGSTSNDNIQFVEESELKDGIYILEPSAMLMKLAPWSIICSRFKAKKLGKSSHIFISNELPENFPGRVTSFDKIIKKQDWKSLSGFPASVISRNHPMSAEDIRKKLKLKEGDNNFIYASRIGDKPILLLSSFQKR